VVAHSTPSEKTGVSEAAIANIIDWQAGNERQAVSQEKHPLVIFSKGQSP